MESEIREAVQKLFKEKPEQVEKIEEGLKHDTYSFKASGKHYIIQFSGDNYETHSSLRHCLKSYELFRQTIPLPRAVTEEVQKIDGREYIIVDKVPGKSGEKDITREKVRNAAKALAKIHSFTSFEEDGWIQYTEGKKPEEILENLEIYGFRDHTLKRKKLGEIEEKLEIFREEGLEGLAEKAEEFVEEHGEIFPAKFDAAPVHTDFTPDNVIYQGEEVAAVLDFDYLYSGLPVRDLIKSANSFWMHDPGSDWDIRKEFYKAYSEVKELSEDFEQLEAFFRVETLLRLIAGLIEMDELDEYEIEFYRSEILRELEEFKNF